MRIKLFVVTVGALCLICGNLNAQQGLTKRFRKGDALNLIIWQPWQVGEKNDKGLDLGGQYVIDSRGYVFFPLIGDIMVVSHNSESLSIELTKKFSSYIQDPIIVVEPLIRVVLLGAFRRSGTYLTKPDASLWSLIDMAGGPADDSNLKKMHIERNGKKITRNLLGGFEQAFALNELGIHTGDQIVLPERSSFNMRDFRDILGLTFSLINLYFLVTRIK